MKDLTNRLVTKTVLENQQNIVLENQLNKIKQTKRAENYETKLREKWSHVNRFSRYKLNNRYKKNNDHWKPQATCHLCDPENQQENLATF